MKLNWFSPLPPSRSGIADFTFHVLPALRKHAEIVLWTTQTKWDPKLETYGSVRPYHLDHMPWEELNRADMTIYHMGNNLAFHGCIWLVSYCHPGIVVLHDTCLQHFFAGIYRIQQQDFDGYRDQMKRYYGHEGEAAASKFWDGLLAIEFMAEHYPLTFLALENAFGGVVHTRNSFQNLRRENRWPVAYLPLPYPASPRVEQVVNGTPPYRLVVAGHIDVNRRLDSLLQALADFPERKKFHLDVYGELWDEFYVNTRVRTLGLQDFVTLHGFVSEERLNAALATSHLAVNLRYPTMGEASASQLRFWNYALPTLVTKVGWYAELPETVVAFVRPDNEIVDLQYHLSAFLTDPAHFAAMGVNGRRLLTTQRTPEAYAQALCDFVLEVRRFRPRAGVDYFLKRVGAELSKWMNFPLVQQKAGRLATAITALTSDKKSLDI